MVSLKPAAKVLPVRLGKASSKKKAYHLDYNSSLELHFVNVLPFLKFSSPFVTICYYFVTTIIIILVQILKFSWIFLFRTFDTASHLCPGLFPLGLKTTVIKSCGKLCGVVIIKITELHLKGLKCRELIISRKNFGSLFQKIFFEIPHELIYLKGKWPRLCGI